MQFPQCLRIGPPQAFAGISIACLPLVFAAVAHAERPQLCSF